MEVVHPRPQTLQGEPGVKPETHLLIILSLVCKSDIKEAHCILSSDGIMSSPHQIIT